MKIYITRHGETEWNKEGRLQGWKNSNLSPKGIKNAVRLSERLADVEFDSIYCSPLGRAIETAKHIRGNRKIEIIEIDGLKEMGFGSWEGVLHEEIQELFPKEHYLFWNKPHLFQATDGESFEELISRVTSTFNSIIKGAKGEDILIVAHGFVLKAIYSIIKGHSLEEFWNPPFIKDTSLTIIEVDGEQKQLILEACVSHLV